MAAEMGILPAVMWEMRPVDFSKLYQAHLKRIRQKVTEILLTSGGGYENYAAAWESVYYAYTEQKQPKKQSFISKVGMDQIAKTNELYLKILKEKHGKH